MRFACERCGRSYAVADELRGKTFKMRCKACGHVIVVKGTHVPQPAGKARGAPGEESTPSPVIIPGVPPGDEPLTPAPAVPEPVAPEVNPFVAMPVSAARLGSHGADSHRGEAGGAGLPAPPTEQYIDLVIDEAKAGGGPAQAGERTPPRPPPRSDAAGFQDPFADWEALGETEKGAPAEPIEPARPPPLPARAGIGLRQKWVEPPAPSARAPSAPAAEGLSPKVLAVAGGVAVAAVAVLLFVYVGRGGKSSGPSAPVAARPAPVAVQPAPVAVQPAPVPTPVPAPAEPIPAVAPVREEKPPRAAQRKPEPVKVAREERPPEPRPEPPRSAPQPVPEPPPEPRPAPAAPTATPSAGPAQPKTGQLTPQQIGRIVTANKRAFEQCIAEAGKRDPGLDLSGRQVTLMLTVNPTGKVADPAIDDVELDGTGLGACIKSAAQLMIFPAFEGDPMKVEVPLALGR